MIALRNLLRRKVRSFITLLGISGAIAVFVLIASLTADLRAQVDDVVAAYNTDLLIQSRRAATPLQSRISAAEVEALRTRLGPQVSPVVVGAVREAWSPYILLFGMPRDLIPVIPLMNGAGLTAGDGQMLLGFSAAAHLGIEAGDRVALGDRERTVSGVFRTGSRLFDGASVMEIEDAWRILGQDNGSAYYNLVVVRGLAPHAADRAVEEIMDEFPRLRASTGAEFAGSLQIYRSIEIITRVVGLIALLGGAIVLINTLLISLSERTREIGVLMSIGWRPLMVLRLLLAESLLLCLAGALLGNLFAIGVLRWLNAVGAFGVGWIPVQIDIAAFLASLLVTVIIAVVTLLWPAAVLLRLRPAEALRHG